MTRLGGHRDSSGRHSTAEFVVLILLAGLFVAGTVLTVVIAAGFLDERVGDVQLEILLPLLLLAAVVALVTALAILVGAFHLFDLTDRSKPFGVPEGTLQAIIALTLIMIFAITSLYLRGTFKPDVVVVKGLTVEQAGTIRADELLSRTVERDGTVTVQRLVSVDQDAKDFSNQLLTILGTLVGAVAGFYFGAKSVETGVSAGGGSVIPTNTSPPIIGGTPRTGDTLRVEAGGWTGSPAPSYSYQWQRKGFADPESKWSDIPGATAATYLLVADDAGKTVRAAVTASNSAGTQPAYSAGSDEIGQIPGTTVAPQINGDAREHVELAGIPGEWTAWPAPSFTYQWERATAADQWDSIPEARSSAYRPTRDDVGRRLRIQVTASNTLGSTVATSQPTDPIEGTPVNGTPPSLSGEARLGETLSADTGTWTGWPLVFTYQWERAEPRVATWTPIPGATQSTYLLAGEDVGLHIRVTVKANGTSASSTPTDPVAAAPENVTAPAVQGDATPAGTLTAERGTWVGTSLEHTFHWQRLAPGTSGWVDIAEATSETYDVADADIGAQLRVAVTGFNALGRATGESDPTPPVPEPEHSAGSDDPADEGHSPSVET